MAAGRHLGFCCRSKMRYGRLRTVRVYRRAKFGENISNGGRVIAIFRFSKWRPAAIFDYPKSQPTYKTTHDGALAVLSVLSNFVLIWLTVSKILKIQFFLRFAWNRLTTPTFWGFYEVLMPWTILFLIETPKRHIPGWRRVVWGIDRENPSTRFSCRRRQAGLARYNIGDIYRWYIFSRSKISDIFDIFKIGYFPIFFSTLLYYLM